MTPPSRAWKTLIPAPIWALIGTVFRYAVSGGAAALTLIGVLYVFTELVGLWYIYSAVIASVASFVVSFLLQQRWTFQGHGQDRNLRQLVAFVVLFAANAAINAALLYELVERAGWPYLLAQLFLLVLIAAWNFFIMRFLIFPKQDA